MSAMTPREIVHELNKHIVGQEEAKRAVAIALRNRWRRMQLDSSLRDEITPKNILMIGPTGVGKTEIARRLAKLADAPFLKVEATKFTELASYSARNSARASWMTRKSRSTCATPAPGWKSWHLQAWRR